MTTIEVTWSMKPTLIPCSISGRNDSSSASMSSSVRLWANPISTVSPGRATAASSIFGSLTGGPPVGVDRELEAVLVYVFDLAVPAQEIFPVGPPVLGLLVADPLSLLGEPHPVGIGRASCREGGWRYG